MLVLSASGTLIDQSSDDEYSGLSQNFHRWTIPAKK